MKFYSSLSVLLWVLAQTVAHSQSGGTSSVALSSHPLNAAGIPRGASSRQLITQSYQIFVYDYKAATAYRVTDKLVSDSDLYQAIIDVRSGKKSPFIERVGLNFDYKPGSTVEFWVADANSALFTLKAAGKSVTVGPTSDLSDLQKLIKALSGGTFSVTGLFPSAGAAAEAGISAVIKAAQPYENQLGVVGKLAKPYISAVATLRTSPNFPDVSALPTNPVTTRALSDLNTTADTLDAAVLTYETHNPPPSDAAFWAIVKPSIEAELQKRKDLEDSLVAADKIVKSFGDHPEDKFRTDYLLKADPLSPSGDEYDVTLTLAPSDPKSGLIGRTVPFVFTHPSGKPLILSSVIPFGVGEHQSNTFKWVSDGSGGFNGTQANSRKNLVPSAAVEYTFFPSYSVRADDNWGVAFGIAAPWENLNKASLNTVSPFVGLAYHRRDYVLVIAVADERVQQLDGSPTSTTGTGDVPTFYGHRTSFFLGFGIRMNLFGSGSTGSGGAKGGSSGAGNGGSGTTGGGALQPPMAGLKSR